MDQWTQVMQSDLTDLLGRPGPHGITHQSPHWPQAGKAGVSLPPPCLPGVCWGHGDRVRRQVAFSLASPSPPTSFVKAGLIVTVESQRCLNPEIPGTPRGGLDMPHPPRLPRAMPTHSRESPATVRPSAAFLAQPGSWRNLSCCQRGEPRKDPHFFPLGWIVRGGPSLHGHWGLACPPLASRDGGINNRILEGGGFN